MKETNLAQKEGKSRRSLMMGALYGIPLLIGGTLTASVGNYLFGRRTTQKVSWADAGDVSDIKSGEPCQIRFERAVVDGWNIRNEESSAWIILDEQRHVTAFSPSCTHLGCAYRWQADKKLFTCPCHGSAFDIRGDVVAGPASRPLDRYSTKVEDNRLWLGSLQDSQGT
ncbi:MAG: ubiquinol-cytochrome c reductase iron-sulfur subunit [Acidobacteriaceae bacterium]|nr:ubiquinol-cytochrome c reductase iron-sulfur subunit [Acidobacteriaceae bacterium]